MAKKVTGYIKLQIPAGKATPAPPVGPALGQHGVNIVQFTKEFNARTADNGEELIRNVCAEKNIISLDCRKAEWSDRALYPAKRIIL